MARQTLIRIDPEDRARAHVQIVEAAEALSGLAAEDGARFLLVVHPHTEEVVQPYLSIMNHVIREAKTAGLPTADLGPFFRDAVDVSEVHRWFYPVDGHCTKLGYSVFADAVVGALRDEDLLPAPAAPEGSAPETPTSGRGDP
jgi:predicted kinase